MVEKPLHVIFAVLYRNAALVKGLRRLPFTEESRVRFPYVVLKAFHLNEGLFYFYLMVNVYVLFSLKDQATYVGMAIDELARLKAHNSGKNRYTKAHIPWTIVYTEQFPDWISARVREKYLKSTAGKKWLKKHFDQKGGITGSLPA